MFPWVYEFSWSAGHLIFLGIFFTVVLVVVATVTTAFLRSSRPVRGKELEGLLWKVEFADLPRDARACRHELAGQVAHRTCSNGFDCRTCATHPTFPLLQSGAAPANEVEVMGVRLPLDRLYHRGHTWVKPLEDGTYAVGLDGFARRVIGKNALSILPALGEVLHANGTGWQIVSGSAKARVLSPLDGEVVAHGGKDTDWVLRIRPTQPSVPPSHLLSGPEIARWATREAERFQQLAAPAAGSLALADGGELVEDLPRESPDRDWDGILGGFFLQA